MINRDDLKDTLVRTGHARELGLPGAEAVLDRWVAGLESFSDYYRQRFGESVNPLDWWRANPAKARAFFDPDTLNLSAVMKAAVWRILVGFEIREVEFVFRGSEPMGSHLRLDLAAPGDTQTEPFESSEPGDAKLLRHVGTIRVNGRLELQGYHAFARQ